MFFLNEKCYLYVIFLGLFLSAKSSFALEFRPGVGVGAKFTDNAKLTPDDKISDVITAGFVGASLDENEGPLKYGAQTSLRRERYVNDTFEQKRYFNLSANASWEMIRERFDWYFTDDFYQSPVVTLDQDTPDNRQDRNTFIFGANITQPISQSKYFSLVPQYSRYYYEISGTSNKQYSLSANLEYKIFRLTSVGLSLSARKIDYDDIVLSDTAFTNFGFNVVGKRVRSNYTINLGVTTVKREVPINPGVSTENSETSELTGSFNYKVDVSSRSRIEALALSEVTDTNTVSQINAPGNPNDVQLAADVIRNNLIGLTYSRYDASLYTQIFGEFRKLRYSDSVEFNSFLKTFGVTLNFPVTQLVSSGIAVKFDDIQRPDAIPVREDKRLSTNVNIKVNLTNNLSGLFYVRYRTNESTESLNNYDEFSVFVSLNYGLGGISNLGRL